MCFIHFNLVIIMLKQRTININTFFLGRIYGTLIILYGLKLELNISYS